MTIETKWGKITANKEVLNLLGSIIYTATYQYESKGYDALEKQAYDIAEAIYNKLDESGYYKNVK